LKKKPKMKKNNCKHCNFCKRVYILYVCMPSAQNYLYCTLHKKITDSADVCENRQDVETEYDLSANRLDEAEKDIRLIAEYLKGAN